MNQVPPTPASPEPPSPTHEPSRSTLPNYRTPEAVHARRRRRTLPRSTGIGFSAAAAMITICWLALAAADRFVAHAAVYLAASCFAAGVILLPFKKSRGAGIGVLCALGVWLLMFGICYSMRGVPPWVWR